jgi:hypothetical protein
MSNDNDELLHVMSKKSNTFNAKEFLDGLFDIHEESKSLDTISSDRSIERDKYVKTTKGDIDLYRFDKPIKIGNLEISCMNETISRKGQTCNKATSRGNGKLFNVRGEKIALQIVETKWETGDHDISMMKVDRGPIALKRLEHGLRIGIHKKQDGLLYMELRQARVDLSSENHWSQDYKADKQELVEGAGVDVFECLYKAGATKIGTKQNILGTEDNTKNILCALFTQESVYFPIVLYVLTRVLPLLSLYPNSK